MVALHIGWRPFRAVILGAFIMIMAIVSAFMIIQYTFSKEDRSRKILAMTRTVNKMIKDAISKISS